MNDMQRPRKFENMINSFSVEIFLHQWSIQQERKFEDNVNIVLTPKDKVARASYLKKYGGTIIDSKSVCQKLFSDKFIQKRQIEAQIYDLNKQLQAIDSAATSLNEVINMFELAQNVRLFKQCCVYLNTISKHIYKSGDRLCVFVPFYTTKQNSANTAADWTLSVRYVLISWKFPTPNNPIEPGKEDVRLVYSAVLTHKTMSQYYFRQIKNTVGGLTAVKKWPVIQEAVDKISGILNECYDESYTDSQFQVLGHWINSILREPVKLSTEYELNRIRGAITGKTFGI